MRLKRLLTLATACAMQAVFFCPVAMAQIEETDEETETETEVEVEDEDEVIISDEEGNEEEIDFPEAMTYDLDSLLQLYTSKTYLQTSSDCQMKDENPTFPKEVYIDRLRRMPTIIEMSYNEVVQTFIDRYTGRLRRSVSYMLGASNFYMPLFEEALEAYQLPLELKYLPIIESALKPTAVSRVGATGLWQFMLTTGKDYGLIVDNYTDERRDPERASYAAAHYLKDLYGIFGDWSLVLAAYNCGPANITKAIHRARLAADKAQEGEGVEKDFWKIYPYLPKETRGYVPAFIAANYVMNYYCEHNICPMSSELPAKTDTVIVNRNVDLRQISAVLDIDIEQLRALNPMYRRDVVPGTTRPSVIRMLPQDVTRFIDLQDSIYNYNAKEYFTKRDETKVTDGPSFVSKRSKGRRSSRSRATRGRRSSGQTVTVRRGDNLGAIARRNGVSVKQLQRLNGLSGTKIKAGQKLRVK